MKLYLLIIVLLFVTSSYAQCPFHMLSGEVTSNDAYIQASLRGRPCRRLPFAPMASARVVVSRFKNFRKLMLSRVIITRRDQGTDPRTRPGAYIARINLKNLEPATTYYYKFYDEYERQSPIGLVTTLPDPDSTDEVHFVHMSCANINPYPISGGLRDYVKNKKPQFTIFNGDVVYSDRIWLLSRNETYDDVNRCCTYPEFTKEYYLSLYEDQRDDSYTGEGFAEALYSAPTFMLWDDHEVSDDFSGNKFNPSLFFGDPFNDVRNPVSSADAKVYTKLGRDAFFTMNALPPSERLQKEDYAQVTNSKRRIFRKFRVGKDVEIFILDLRSYRQPLKYPQTRMPIKPIGVPDNFSCIPPGNSTFICDQILEPKYEPDYRKGWREFLGRGQRRWLRKSLRESKAKFKLIISSVMMLEFFYNPPDRWEGYWAERKLMLEFIQKSNIKNVVFLTGDYHASIFARINPGVNPPIYEVTTGSVGALMRGTPFIDWLFQYGANGQLFKDKPVKYINTYLSNFMSVRVKNGKLTIRTLGPDGKVVTDLRGNRGELVLS